MPVFCHLADATFHLRNAGFHSQSNPHTGHFQRSAAWVLRSGTTQPSDGLLTGVSVQRSQSLWS
jgi:hypothetical protein